MTVGGVALVSLLAFEALAVATAMPTVARALDGLALYALAFGGAFAAGMVGMVVSGAWSDARGPVAPLHHGVFWFAAGLLVAGTAPVMELLVLGRVLQGFGGGLVSVALYVVVARVYPEQLRRRVFAALAAAWVVPSLVGPAVAGLTVQYLDWRWVFLAVPALAVPAVLVMRPGLRPLRTARPDADPAGEPDAGSADAGRDTGPTGAGAARRIGWSVAAAFSAVLLHYGGQQRGGYAAVLLAVALAGLAASATRLLPAGLIRARPGLPVVVLLRGLAAAAFVGAEVLIPLLLSRERGLSPTAAGSVIAVGALAWSGGSWLQGRLRQPVPGGGLLRLGTALIATGIGTVALVLLPSAPVVVAALGWAVTGTGMGIVYPSLSVLTLHLSAPADQGRNSSALQLGDYLGSAVVLAVGGALLGAAAANGGEVAAGAGSPDATGPGTLVYLVGFAVAVALSLLGAFLAGRVIPVRRI